eukprot:4327066-Pyramimonas_sp.AAC.1
MRQPLADLVQLLNQPVYGTTNSLDVSREPCTKKGFVGANVLETISSLSEMASDKFVCSDAKAEATGELGARQISKRLAPLFRSEDRAEEDRATEGWLQMYEAGTQECKSCNTSLSLNKDLLCRFCQRKVSKPKVRMAYAKENLHFLVHRDLRAQAVD